MGIAQTACPRCTVNECSNDNYNNSAYDCSMDHEASFDYTDAGAVCHDQIDGQVNYTTINDVDVEQTGVYIVTYRARNSVSLSSRCVTTARWRRGPRPIGPSTLSRTLPETTLPVRTLSRTWLKHQARPRPG